MTARTFLCEGHRHTDLDGVEQNVFGSHQPWPLVSTPVPEGRPNKAGGETPGSGFRRRLKPRRGDRHGTLDAIRSPLRGFVDTSIVFRGLRPRLYSVAALRLLYSVAVLRLLYLIAVLRLLYLAAVLLAKL